MRFSEDDTQHLHDIIESKDCEIERLRLEIARLKQRLKALGGE